MKKVILFLVFILIALNAKDIKGSKDVEFLKRFKGSEIVAYKHENYSKFKLILSPIKKIKIGEYKLPEYKKIYGEHFRIVYQLPPNTSALEAVKNYEDEINNLGGKVIFSCEEEECGGDINIASFKHYSDTPSIMLFYEDYDKVLSYNKNDSLGYCALGDKINNLTLLNGEIPDKNAYISVIAYTGQGVQCKKTKNRTYVVLDVIITKKRENKMVQVKADEMKSKIDKEGKIALYGIYFDTDKAVVKPESEPTIKEIAKLLKDNPKLKLLIVGHTDNQGTFVYNKGLSQRRAKAVVKELVSKYGINANRLHPVGVSYAAPVATNNTEEGRAKNRRVELVELSK